MESLFVLLLLLKVGSLYDILIRVHIICKCAWYVASGVFKLLMKEMEYKTKINYPAKLLAS